MIACLLIPGFDLRAALRKQPGLALRPAALAPVAGAEPLLGPVTAEAERLGVRPGMRLGVAIEHARHGGDGDPSVSRHILNSCHSPNEVLTMPAPAVLLSCENIFSTPATASAPKANA